MLSVKSKSRLKTDIPHQKNTPINNYLKKSVNGLL